MYIERYENTPVLRMAKIYLRDLPINPSDNDGGFVLNAYPAMAFALVDIAESLHKIVNYLETSKKENK